MNRARTFPIVESGMLVGVISRADVLAGSTGEDVMAAGSREVHVIRPNNTLAEAAEKMLHFGVGRLPVVASDEEPVLLGLITLREILQRRC